MPVKGFGALTDTLTTVVGTLDGSYVRVTEATDGILGALVVIDLVMLGCWVILGAESVAAFAKKLIAMQIWLILIRGFQATAKWLMHHLVDMALAASGTGGGWKVLLDPSDIVGRGLKATLPIADKVEKMKGWHFGTQMLLGLVLLVLMGAFIIMAVNITIAVIEFYIYLCLGGLLIPFAIFSHTRFLADKGINAVLASILKLTAYAFVVGIIQPTLGNLEFHPSFGHEDGLNWNDIFALCMLVAFCTGLLIKAPQLAAGLIHGSPSISGSGLMLGAAGAAMYYGGRLGSAALSGGAAGARWAYGAADRAFDAAGAYVTPATESPMAATNRAGAMSGPSAPATIYAVAYAQTSVLQPPPNMALPADVVDAPEASLDSEARDWKEGGDS